MLKSICFFLCLSWGAALGAQTKVLALAGSSRTESLNKKLVQNAARVARELGAEVRVIDLKEYPIPLYDGDLEASDGMPVNAKTIRRLMIDSQVILIASPEYNASVSGLLKNVIDWASRSEEGGWSLEAFEGKRFALMSASTGSRGGAKGLAHLRTILENVGGVVMSQQVAVPRADEAFLPNGTLKAASLDQALDSLIRAALESSPQTTMSEPQDISV